MKNSNLNNEYLDDEIDLRELLRTILISKKLIIIVTLAFSLIAFIYTTQKELEYESTVIIEVGSYDLINGEKIIIEPVPSLINKLQINQISQQLDKLNFNSIEDHFLEINYTSPSPEFNENLINEAIIFAQESHEGVLARTVNSFSDEIKAKELQIDYFKNSTLSNKGSYQLEASNEINKIDSEVVFNKIKINFLLKLLITQKNDLILEDQLMTLQAKVKELEKKKESLKKKITLIDSFDFFDYDVFVFIQEKNSLEKQTKLIKNSSSKTQPIHEFETSEIKTNTVLITSIGTILGFIFSVFILFIRQEFLKNQN